MEARRFTPSDYHDITEWYIAHDQPVPEMADLPEYGFIVPVVACGFLILTDANLGILEWYISNPESPKKARDSALDLITESLVSYGRKYGLKYFKCDTNIPAIAKRAQKHGFKYTGMYETFFLYGSN